MVRLPQIFWNCSILFFYILKYSVSVHTVYTSDPVISYLNIIISYFPHIQLFKI